MHRDFTSAEIRDLILLVNIWDRRFGAENCNYEMFDAMNQLGVCVTLTQPLLRRHAVRMVIKDEKSRRAAWDDMVAWFDTATKGD